MTTRDTILEVIHEVAAESEKTLGDDFGDNTVLLDSGLDSLDFAIIVARLEERLGEDPFAAMDEPVYPKTLGDFVGIYDSFFANQD
ncbi:Phosphopantetheine attachment site [Rubripirellula amarantea]|uniref:Phosphopantetheine attachment site n=1 Tax=Rubripirellula amarantea TaxID=2527999 RepID=A0A5C5WT63_9BACT|nr:acyl carrier protein [Rubripirellula amarantea]TWT53718.1 Phosphopantetheine attachment site [Rubripirellula amarantea]